MHATRTGQQAGGGRRGGGVAGGRAAWPAASALAVAPCALSKQCGAGYGGPIHPDPPAHSRSAPGAGTDTSHPSGTRPPPSPTPQRPGRGWEGLTMRFTSATGPVMSDTPAIGSGRQTDLPPSGANPWVQEPTRTPHYRARGRGVAEHGSPAVPTRSPTPKRYPGELPPDAGPTSTTVTSRSATAALAVGLLHSQGIVVVGPSPSRW